MPELSIVDSQPLPDASPPRAYSAPRGSVSDMVTAAADKYGVPQPLAHAVAQMESGYNPRARSGVGAMGVMQLMPATAQSLGVKNPWDAQQNVDGGVKYLAQLSRQFDGDPQLTLAAYNAGPGAVNKYGGVPPYRETQNYVAKGTRLMASNAPAPQPATTGTASRLTLADVPSDTPATQAAPAADTGGNTGGDDIMSRIMRGEQVQVTPSDILRIAFGPTGSEQTPTLSVAKSEPLSILKSEPLPAAPPTPPQQPPALERALNAFTQSSGLQTLGGLSSAFPALAGRISGIPDYANEQRFKNTVSGLYQGIVGEPARISSELQKSGEALLKGDINAAADHIWFAIPYLGAVGAQMKEYLDRGDVAGALGHAAGALGSAAIATPEGRAAVAEAPAAVADAAAKVPEAVSNIPGAVADAAPKVTSFVKAAAPDVAKGGAKMAAGTAMAKVPVPEVLKFGTGLPLVGAGAKQVIAGLKKGWTAAKGAAPEAEAAAAVPEAAAAMPEPAAVPASGPIITPPPADTSYVRSVPAQPAEVEPGFTRPAATPGTTSTPWPGTAPPAPALSFDELARSLTGKSPTKLTVAERASVQGIYDRITQGLPPEAPPSPRVMPQAAAAQAFPEAYSEPKPAPAVAPPPAESFKPGDVVQWRSQGVDQFTEPRAIRGFSPDGKYAFVEGTNTGLPVEQLIRTEAPAAVPPASASSAAQALYDELRRSGTLEPEPAPAEKPAFEQRARDAKVDKLYELITSKKVPQDWVARFTPESWRILAHEVGVPEPSAATIRQLKARLADYYRPRMLPATTPAEAQAAFDAARARVQ